MYFCHQFYKPKSITNQILSVSIHKVTQIFLYIMIKHIVLFQLRQDISDETRRTVMDTFKREIEALPHSIPCIRQIHVGFNVNPAEKWDVCLESTFDSLQDLDIYAQHPLHKAAAGDFVPYVAGRACTDFEV